MNRTTLTALKGSIKKWEKIVAGKGEALGIENCPLCRKFIGRDSRKDCELCPVRAKTGRSYCLRTPYQKWLNYMKDRELKKVYNKKSLSLAEEELKFLKSLLPKEAK